MSSFSVDIYKRSIHNRTMKKAKKLPAVKMGPITLGPFKKVIYYQADIDGPDTWLEIVAGVGKQVITQEEYVNIGINHILKHAVDNKSELAQNLQKEKKRKGVLVDPPSGWQYGFPARYIKEEHGSMEDFLRFKKYPEKDIAFAIQNMRHIGEEEA